MKKMLSIVMAVALLISVSTGSVFAGQGGVQQMQQRNQEHNQEHNQIQNQGQTQKLVQLELECQSEENSTETTIEDSDLARFHSDMQLQKLAALVELAKTLGLEPVTDFEATPLTVWGVISEEDYGYLLALFELLGDNVTETLEDTESPYWETGATVTGSAISTDQLTLNWDRAMDETGVTGYRISYEEDGVETIKYVRGTHVHLYGLTAETTYTFKVDARDAAGNWSEEGLSVSVTTRSSDS